MKVVHALLLANVFLTACATTYPLSMDGPPYEAVIFAAANDDSDAWTPSEEEVRAFAEQLPVFIAQQEVTKPIGIGPLDQYVCQYTGAKRNGTRALSAQFISKQVLQEFFGSRPELDKNLWKRGPIGIDGSGADVFNVVYLVEASRYIELTVNSNR